MDWIALAGTVIVVIIAFGVKGEDEYEELALLVYSLAFPVIFGLTGLILGAIMGSDEEYIFQEKHQ